MGLLCKSANADKCVTFWHLNILVIHSIRIRLKFSSKELMKYFFDKKVALRFFL